MLRRSEKSAAASEARFIAILLAGYIVGLIPRVDFIAATALFLFVFMAGYLVEVRGTARAAIAACLVLPALLALVAALAGFWPAPRSESQFVLDAAVAMAIPVAFGRRGGLRTAASGGGFGRPW